MDIELLDEILFEWSYRLKDGIPDLDDPNKTPILNQILIERGVDPFFIYEGSILPKPYTGNDTSLKEGLVCLFFDCFKNDKLKQEILKIHLQSKSSSLKKEELKSVISKIHTVYTSNSSNYGAGQSYPKNLDKYLAWAWASRNELDTVNNSLSCANAIHSSISNSKKGTIIRNIEYDNIRKKAVDLIKEEYSLSFKPDNWNPGDVYLVIDKSTLNKVHGSDSINVGKDSLNSLFGEKDKIISLSLKEQRAQAGKASTFLQNVFVKNFDSEVPMSERFGNADNKQNMLVISSVNRFMDYYFGGAKNKVTKSKRQQSYINSISKGNRIHKSINAILKAAGKPIIKSEDIEFVPKEEDFHKQNGHIFTELLAAVKKIRKDLNSENKVKKSEKDFIESRNKFIKYLEDLKVEVASDTSESFLKKINTDNDDESATKMLSAKIAVYSTAILIIDKWLDKENKVSPAFKKITKIANPFVALTAYAIAEAGISPNFWKVIGSATRDIGHAEFFNAAAEVTVDSSTSPITLYDSSTAAGFELRYTTSVGNQNYKTTLTFRFANSELRIEVSKFIKV
jgi:hypothetical protein